MSYIALNASSKLTGVVGVGVTTVPVTPGTGTDFEVSSNHSYVTFENGSGTTETCKITGRSGDNLTVVRTKAVSWAIGDVIECRPCAEAMADYAVAPQIDGSGAATIADADSIGFVDASASSILAKITWANVKATLKTYFDTLYRLVTDDVTLAAGKAVIFEGTTDDAFETTLSAGDPTADRALVLPDKSGTLAVTADIAFAADAVTGIGNGRATDITISSAGEVTMPLQPAFLANASAIVSNITGDNTTYTVVFDNEVFDRGGDFNTGTGVFTAPVTGIYRLSTAVNLTGLTASHVIHDFAINTSNRDYSTQDIFFGGASPYSNERSIALSVLADMDAGDTARVKVTIRSGTKVVGHYGGGSANYTHFCGELVA